MADTNQIRRADRAVFSEDDPFAELMRIMGGEPKSSASAQADAEDDFDIDLEKELAGDLDFAEFDEEPAAAEEPAVEAAPVEEAATVEEPVAQETPAEADASAAADSLDAGAALDAAFDDALAFLDDEEPAAFEDDTVEPEFVAVEPEPVAEDDLGAALERELALQEQPAEDPVADDLSTIEDDLAAVEDDLHVIDDLQIVEDDLAAVEEAAAEDDAAVSLPPEEEPVAEAAFDDEEGMAEVDMDFSFLEEEKPAAEWEEPAAEAAADEPEAAVAPEEEPAVDEPLSFAPDEEPRIALSPVEPSADVSLEDELSALLAADALESADDSWAQPVAEDDGWAQPVAEEAPQPADDTWHPSVNTFGRANFTALRRAEVDSASFEPEMPAPASPAAPVSMLGDDDFADIFRDEPEPQAEAAVEEPAVTEVASAPQELNGFEALAALASWQPGRARGEPAPAEAHAPDVETVEVSEAAFAVADDLDIPDVDYGAPEPAPALYDDLEGEIAQAFGDLSVEEPAAAQAAWTPASSEPAGWSAAPAAAYGSHAESYADHEQPADAYALGEGQWQEGDEFAETDFDYEDDLDQAIAMSTYEEDEAARPEPRRRGLLVAAIVAGVAVVGGVGAFGMSLLGGGSDAPVFVRADTDPMKVRPENPGGTVVPNQDNEVYQRVAGGASDAAPEQERLITTAEEPVDMAVRASEPTVLAPGIGEEGDDFALDPLPTDEPGDAASALPKIEDRIEPASDEGASLAAVEDTPLVAPRRVRTMIVRPDGTLVPNEDPPVAAVETEPEPETILSAPPLLRGDTPAEEAVAEEDDGPVVETPDTVAVVPTRRVEPQTAAAPAASTDAAPVRAVQQPAAQQTPAATPVSAPAAAAPAGGAAGDWSMQIASQPTAEGAQSTYQDLARRYGSVLQGRGVNIVRADIEGMGVYYRVRIPASSRDEAIQLCTRYKAAGGSCFVSR